MRRRTFIGSSLAAWVGEPMIVRGQETRRAPKIGVLWHAGNAEEEAEYQLPFKAGLRDLGFFDGKNISLINKYAAEEYTNFKTQAKELVESGVDIIVAVTPPAALAAQGATKDIPIVFVLVPDPERFKLVDNVREPGGNITGLSQVGIELTPKRLQLFKEALPHLRRISVFINPGNGPVHGRYFEEAKKAGEVLSIEVHSVEVGSPDDIENGFKKAAKVESSGIYYSRMACSITSGDESQS